MVPLHPDALYVWSHFIFPNKRSPPWVIHFKSLKIFVVGDHATWGFPKMRVSQHGCFIMERPIELSH